MENRKISDEEIMQCISNTSFAMSDYQMNNFVIKSQVTDYRQIRQIALELSGRYDILKQSEVDLEKLEITRDKIENALKTCEDEFDRRFLELDLKTCKKDIEVVKRKKVTQVNDYNFFANKLKERFQSQQEFQEFLDNPEEERKYWIARMGKQAAIDILSMGRISVGNMDSIAMMSEDDQVKVLSVAVQYSGLMSVGMNKLQQQFQPYLKELSDNSTKLIPTFDKIEDNLNVKLLNELKNDKKMFESFQFTDKPET